MMMLMSGSAREKVDRNDRTGFANMQGLADPDVKQGIGLVRWSHPGRNVSIEEFGRDPQLASPVPLPPSGSKGLLSVGIFNKLGR
jgi:hypothetical protein